MSESVLARVPADHLNSDGQPMTGNDWKLHAMIDPNAVHDRGFRRRPGGRTSWESCWRAEASPVARAERTVA